jgi:serine/threonine-protein kinase RsbW
MKARSRGIDLLHSARFRNAPRSMSERQLHLTVGSRFENVELVQAAIDEAIAARGADEDARHWVGLAVREAVANAIKHGNQQDPASGSTWPCASPSTRSRSRSPTKGRVSIRARCAIPLAPENLFRTNGRGIFYMRRFMDEVSYGSTPAAALWSGCASASRPNRPTVKEP